MSRYTMETANALVTLNKSRSMVQQLPALVMEETSSITNNTVRLLALITLLLMALRMHSADAQETRRLADMPTPPVAVRSTDSLEVP